VASERIHDAQARQPWWASGASCENATCLASAPSLIWAGAWAGAGCASKEKKKTTPISRVGVNRRQEPYLGQPLACGHLRPRRGGGAVAAVRVTVLVVRIPRREAATDFSLRSRHTRSAWARTGLGANLEGGALDQLRKRVAISE